MKLGMAKCPQLHFLAMWTDLSENRLEVDIFLYLSSTFNAVEMLMEIKPADSGEQSFDYKKSQHQLHILGPSKEMMDY